MSSPSLLSLPPEIIQHTAFLLLASSPPALPSLGQTSSSPSSTGPLGPPSQLLPLFLTHRSLHATLTQPAFLAKVLRLKFDVGAVERRRQGERTMEKSNTLTLEEMKRMLICWCDCLTFIRAFVTKLFSISAAAREGGGVVPQTAELTLTGDELQHVYAHMFTCFLMMLDNEGKNYAQLKHAGVHTLVDWFIRKCIWDPSLPYLSPAALQKLEEENDGASPLPSAYGWPIDTPHTSAAFLLYWLVLERPMLYNMLFVEKEEIIRVILPFVVMPFRYSTTEAPVNHFNLPLDVRKEKGNEQDDDDDDDDDEAIPTQQDPLSFYLPAYARAASDGQAQEDGTVEGGISLEERREQEKEHGMPLAYPIYTPPYSRCLTVPYSTVNSIWANSPDGLARNPRKVPVQLVSLPPASMGAKMLFVAMREARPVVIPPVLPPGMERRDYAIIGADVESDDEEQEQDGQEGTEGAEEEEDEGAAREARRRRRMRTWRKKYLDRGKSARLPRGAEWDWDRGMAVAVNPHWTPDGPRAVRRPSSSTPPSTKEEEEERLAIELEWENDNLIKPGDEESKKWDTMYWRMRMCADYTRVASPIAGGVGGERYVLGSMTGSVSSKPAESRAVGSEWSRGGWVGKMYLPQGIQYMRLLMNTPYYPGSTHTGLPPGISAPEQPYANALRDFSESSLGLVMQHVFVDFREHYRVCLCVKGGQVQVVRVEGEREVQGEGEMGCGVIPLPPLERRVWDDGVVIQHGQGPRPRERVGRRSRRRIRPREEQQQEVEEEEEEQRERQEQEQEQEQEDAEPRRDQTAPEPRAREGDDVDIPLDASEIEEAIAEMADGNVHAQGSSARGPPALRSGRAAMDPVLPGSSRRDQQVDGAAAAASLGAPSTSQQDQALESDEEEKDEEDDGDEEEDDGSAHSSDSEAEYTDSEDDSNEDDDEDDEDMLPTYIDTSINNAWFPGEVGGMAWVGREGVPLKGRNKWVDEQVSEENRARRREEVVFACNFGRADPMTEDVCVRVREAALCLPPAVSYPNLPPDGSLPDSSSSSSSSSMMTLQIHERDVHGKKLVASTEGENYSKPGWVYETWDKERMSMHDLFGCSSWSSASGHVGADVDVDKPKFNDHCPGCLAHERSETLYRLKEAEEARKMLDGAMKALGEPPSSEEDEDMEDLDLDGMDGLKDALEGVVVGDSAGQMDIDEDGHSQERDRSKATGGDVRLAPACNGGVRDIVITGETTVGESYDNFQAPAAFYGRVRKWDGLIGILRYSRVTTSHIFIFGYVVGGNNFVGEWRVAGGDPIRPVWGNAFVMSMRDEDAE